MTQRRRDAKIVNLIQRLENAATIVPTIRDHLNEQRAHISTLSAAAGNSGPQGIGGHSDPTLRTVMELQSITYREGCIDDMLAAIEVGISALDKECRNALGHRASTIPPDLCHCGQMVAYERAPNGHIAVDPDGFCHDHRLEAKADQRRADDSNARRRRKHAA